MWQLLTSLTGLEPRYLKMIASGLLQTIQLTIWVTIFGIIVGLIGGIIRTSGPKWLSRLWGAYVEIIRNTPFIVQLFFIVFGISSMGTRVNANFMAILALVINLGAYATEIIRAGIQATPKGQWEACRVLGLSKAQTFIHVVIPPAMRRIYPALVSQCILVMLGSSVISQVSYEELTYQTNLVQSQSFLSMQTYITATILYLILSIVMRWGLLKAGNLVFGLNKGVAS